MSSYHVRISGSVYGPFTLDQLGQMVAAGRMNGQAELSTDRQKWVPAASVLGTSFPLPKATHAFQTASAGPAHNPGASSPDPRKYLEGLRNKTRYPFYRTTILICSIMGYIVAALPVLGLFGKVIWFGISSIQVFEPFAALFASVFIGVFITVIREMFSMYADFVDSTLDHHSRNS